MKFVHDDSDFERVGKGADSAQACSPTKLSCVSGEDLGVGTCRGTGGGFAENSGTHDPEIGPRDPGGQLLRDGKLRQAAHGLLCLWPQVATQARPEFDMNGVVCWM